MKLGVNVDHVATLRNTRGTSYPSVIEAARAAVKCGADFITVHLREDRRHIKDSDVFELKRLISAPINLEMAATQEMVDIAKKVSPEYVCLVPEKREEVTTESGLDIKGLFEKLVPVVKDIQLAGIKVTLFIEPEEEYIHCARKLNADKVELHVGAYCMTGSQEEFDRIARAAEYSHANNIECHAGHGINYKSAAELSKIQHITALNVGHFLICDSILHGLGHAVKKMKNTISPKG